MDQNFRRIRLLIRISRLEAALERSYPLHPELGRSQCRRRGSRRHSQQGEQRLYETTGVQLVRGYSTLLVQQYFQLFQRGLQYIAPFATTRLLFLRRFLYLIDNGTELGNYTAWLSLSRFKVTLVYLLRLYLDLLFNRFDLRS